MGASVGSQLVHCARRATGRAVVPLGRSAERSGVGAVVTLFAGSRSGLLAFAGQGARPRVLLGARAVSGGLCSDSSAVVVRSLALTLG